MKPKDRPENPLALGMMAMLAERPMHPYEIASTLRTRHGEEAIKIRFGSLYSVIGQLVDRAWIEALEVAQSGRRPEHTTYRLTELGRVELTAWMREIIAEPVKEYPKFEAGLVLMSVLEPEDAAARLEERLARLEGAIDRLQSDIDGMLKQGLDPLSVADADYRLAMLKAERDFCRNLRPWLVERARRPRGETLQ
ncbi:MAG TPA: PadR family transcriptional regulator [Caulobacteraceae bacterium]|nr:PadR family transcriptional regulator [Caulobacteraceae bacterium]